MIKVEAHAAHVSDGKRSNNTPRKKHVGRCSYHAGVLVNTTCWRPWNTSYFVMHQVYRYSSSRRVVFIYDEACWPIFISRASLLSVRTGGLEHPALHPAAVV